jgi:hypothetical protein
MWERDGMGWDGISRAERRRRRGDVVPWMRNGGDEVEMSDLSRVLVGATTLFGTTVSDMSTSKHGIPAIISAATYSLLLPSTSILVGLRKYRAVVISYACVQSIEFIIQESFRSHLRITTSINQHHDQPSTLSKPAPDYSRSCKYPASSLCNPHTSPSKSSSPHTLPPLHTWAGFPPAHPKTTSSKAWAAASR